MKVSANLKSLTICPSHAGGMQATAVLGSDKEVKCGVSSLLLDSLEGFRIRATPSGLEFTAELDDEKIAQIF